jgi:hypothetical protein
VTTDCGVDIGHVEDATIDEVASENAAIAGYAILRSGGCLDTIALLG